MREKLSNPFAQAWVAPLYAAGRPDVHTEIARYVGSMVGNGSFCRSIDLACGTGLSARAFAGLADTVLGVDAVRSMIGEAEPHPRVRYAIAEVERLPICDARFDLATIGCAFHWCDVDLLFSEVARVLRSDGIFVIYDNWFDGAMRGSKRAKEWLDSVFRPRFPLPPRGPIFESEMTPETLFQHVKTDFVEQWLPLTPEELARYLTTQSSAVHAVECGVEDIEDIQAFALMGLESVFGESRVGRFKFLGPVSILRRR